ncbi:thioredoxin [Nocardioides sp. BP30]|uniref:thioredoxin n=1 Tax=Nocardioides sp. BP30 TaxID=3036374 RepID=UPI002468AC6E|nr:thioredoxin [Nocardioides sp. BP30]WGL50797.1 thioredoxin [Nocardioides sp. BP30]
MSGTTAKTAEVECSNCGTINRVPAVADGTPRCGKCSTPLRWVVDATDDEFHAVVDESSLPVLVDVWAPWCGPCRMVSPALERLAGELAGNLKLVKVNADDNPAVSQRFEVRSIPTLILLSRGEVLDKQIGALPEHQLRSWLESRLPTGAS